MKKILYVSGTYMPVFAGAEISAHNVLKNFKKKYDVLVLTDKQYAGNGQFEGINIKTTSKDMLKKDLDSTIDEFKPDILFTQQIWSDSVLEVAKIKGIFSVLRVCSVPFYLDLSSSSKFSPSSIVAVSDFVAEYIHNNWNRDSHVINPFFDENRLVSGKINNFYNKYITLFNPSVKKGGTVFKEISELLPEKNFLVVEAWDQFRTKEGNFDDERIQQICNSLRIPYNGQRPVIETNFPDNVKIINPIINVREIYADTRILCVPSQCQETFARVSYEAFANRIPVIGSAIGGLEKNVREGGICVDDFSNPYEWVKAINFFDDNKQYQNIALKGRKIFEKNSDNSVILKKYEKVFNL